ncbi:MAG: hypothetical protein Rubg2KO_07720 [Rubricoccaceae bacterium]
MPSSPATAVLTYNLKLWLAGFAATLFIPLSLAAMIVDLLTRSPYAEGLSGRVLRASAELEAAIDVHGDLTDIRVRPSTEQDAPSVFATA